jgi:hypothetical protein
MSDGVVACVVTIGVMLALVGLFWLDLRARSRRRRNLWGASATGPQIAGAGFEGDFDDGGDFDGDGDFDDGGC